MRVSDTAERRTSVRVRTRGTIVVQADDVAVRGRIVDLSPLGVSYLPEVGDEVATVGERVRVELRLDGATDWIRMTGQVLRAGEDVVVLRFDYAASV